MVHGLRCTAQQVESGRTGFAGITQATGVQCSFNMPAEDASTKLNLLMISRNLPDIITTSDGDLRSELIAAGLVWDLDELLKTYVPESHLFTHSLPT